VKDGVSLCVGYNCHMLKIGSESGGTGGEGSVVACFSAVAIHLEGLSKPPNTWNSQS
jgi:hypothetical protein